MNGSLTSLRQHDIHAWLVWSAGLVNHNGYTSARISKAATAALKGADELAVADISWYELAWLARHERLTVTIPILSWLQQMAAQVRTIPTTPAIAATAAALPSSFPSDPADRLIYGGRSSPKCSPRRESTNNSQTDALPANGDG